MDRLDILNYIYVGTNDESRTRNIFRLGGDAEKYTEIFEAQMSFLEYPDADAGEEWYETVMVLRQNDGSDYFYFVWVNCTLYSG